MIITKLSLIYLPKCEFKVIYYIKVMWLQVYEIQDISSFKFNGAS